MNRSKKAALNLLSQLLLQLVTAVCGFIVPKLILESFGSSVNGLVSSIAQFLAIITLMESGFGYVAKTAFYKPLASGDRVAMSGVYNATEAFFRKIAFVFAAYCVVLAIGFPFINNDGFDFAFTATLVLILGISSFMQYYFGMSYTLALNADQLSFISAFFHVGLVILNAIVTVVLLNLGAGIHMVKLGSAMVFLLKPIAMNLYGRHRYRIDRKVPRDNQSIAQKWDNLAQGVASYIHTKASYILITIFLTFRDVSVFSVYSLITTSLSAVITSISTGFVAGLGNMYANGEKENYHRVFSLYEFVNTVASFGFFTVAAVTIMQFIGIYTANLTDANYHQPLFGMILILGELIYCLRLPYHYMIANAGHFKQTKKGAYVEAGLNIVLSLCLLPVWGIVGLAVGTTIAMTCRTTELIIYCSKNITKISVFSAIKRISINMIAAIISMAVCSMLRYEATGFISWAFFAAFVGAITFVIIMGANLIFYRSDIKFMLQKVKNSFSR